MAEPSIEEFLAAYPPEIRALALETKNLILRVIPSAVEIVDPPSKIVAYGFGRKYADLICAIAPYSKYLNLIFSKGAELPDPDQRLTGTGKRARHIKIRTIEDLTAASTRLLIEEALQKARP